MSWDASLFFTDPKNEAINNFKFSTDTSVLASWRAPALTIVIYFVVVEALKYHMQGRDKPYNIPRIITAYNFAMSIMSACLGLSLVMELIQLSREQGKMAVWCDPEHKLMSGRHFFYYYINYTFKYIELIDTVFLVLRKRPIIFLHQYHHAATLVLCWVQISSGTCIQWMPIVLNLAVHTAMYYYFALSVNRIKVWWKQYLTAGQIIQFMGGLAVGGTLFMFRILHDLGYEQYPGCSGSYFSSIFGLGILFSYLVLFVQMYYQMYDKGDKKGKGANHDLKRSSAIKAD